MLGYADPDRLGVGGWSYGGILTDYVITKTERASKRRSAGRARPTILACYGTDHYQLQWELELGLPWENRELYTKLSPITYVAEHRDPHAHPLGRGRLEHPREPVRAALHEPPTPRRSKPMLVVYPGQSHGIRRPTYQKDRYERYLAWFGRLLKGEAPASTTAPQP